MVSQLPSRNSFSFSMNTKFLVSYTNTSEHFAYLSFFLRSLWCLHAYILDTPRRSVCLDKYAKPFFTFTVSFIPVVHKQLDFYIIASINPHHNTSLSLNSPSFLSFGALQAASCELKPSLITAPFPISRRCTLCSSTMHPHRRQPQHRGQKLAPKHHLTLRHLTHDATVQRKARTPYPSG